MMVEAEATEGSHGTWSKAGATRRRPRRSWPQGLDAAKPFIAQLVEAQAELANAAAEAGPGVTRSSCRTSDDVYDRRRGRRQATTSPPRLTRSRDKQERQSRDDGQDRVKAVAAREAVAAGSSRAGEPSEIGAAYKLGHQEARPRAASSRDKRPHRRPRPGRHPSARTPRCERDPARPRLGALRARRDPDPGRHHPRTCSRWSSRSTRCRPRVAAGATCTSTSSRRSPPVRPAAWARRSAARSATAALGRARAPAGAPEPRGVPLRDPPALRGAWAPTARPRWARSAPRPCRCCSAGVPLQRVRRRHRDGPRSRARSTARLEYVGADRHPRRRGRLRRHGLQGRRHQASSSPRIQLDTKLDGIPADGPGFGALTQARDARLAILDVHGRGHRRSRGDVDPTAPRDHHRARCPVDKIGEVIGPEGQGDQRRSRTTPARSVSIEDDGTVYIGATDGEAAEAARAAGQRDREPDHARRSASSYLGTVVKIDQLRCVHRAAAGQGRPAAHHQAAQVSPAASASRTSRTCVAVGQKIQVEDRRRSTTAASCR